MTREFRLVRVWPWLAAAATGVLLTLCYAPWNLGSLSWIALTPLICAVWFSPKWSRREPLRHALLGYVAGLIFFTCVFYWLGALGTLFEQPWLHGLPLLVALYLGMYVAFWAWFIGALVAQPLAAGANASPFLSSRRNLLVAGLGACAWVTHEWVRGWLFSGFGWNDLGVALHRQLAMIQIVDITGVAGLSFLITFCNLMAVILVRRIVAELGPVFLKRIRWEFSLTVALVVFVFAYGVRQLMQRPKHTEQLRVAAVQPNIPQEEKFTFAFEDKILAELGGLTELAATTQPHLLLWPEAATPRGMFADEGNYRFVTQLAARGDFGMLIGSADFDAERSEHLNSALLLTRRGQEIQTYRKMHLVPFGEYMPLRKSFPLFAMIAGELVPEDFGVGRDFTILNLPAPAMRLAPLICFEDTLGNLTRRFVGKGAQILVNITNDGWFLETAAAEQHLANALFRAVENRRPLVRCANTGVTCAVTPFGRVERWLEPFQRGFVTREVEVQMDAPLTFYTRYGNWFAHVAAGVTAVGVIARLRRARRAVS